MSLWAKQESTRAVVTQELFLPFLKIVFASALNFTGGFLGGGPFISAKKSLGARAERSIESVVLAEAEEDALAGQHFAISCGMRTPSAASSATVKIGGAGTAALADGGFNFLCLRQTLRDSVRHCGQ